MERHSLLFMRLLKDHSWKTLIPHTRVNVTLVEYRDPFLSYLYLFLTFFVFLEISSFYKMYWLRYDTGILPEVRN